jgi:predicted PurR-regulated permease PerM
VSDLTEKITDSIGGYLMGMVILALCNATFVFLMFLFLGLPFPLLLAVTTFCITLIPLVGTVLMWIIASIVALFADPIGALVFAAAYLVYMQLEAYVLTPRIMNRTISIPGALVVIGALVGGTLLGLLGALVAIPVTASLLLILKQVVVPRQDAKIAPEM